MSKFFIDGAKHVLIALDDAAAAPAGMEELVANTTDAAQEKHVPVVKVEHEGRLLEVSVGSTAHPMEEAHYIEWIALEAEGRVCITRLTPGQSPKAYFPGNAKSGTVYAYCNLHGLWRASF